MRRAARSVWAAAALVFLGSCHRTEQAAPEPSASAPPASAVPAAVAQPRGDPERGHALAVRFECNRCHDGTGEAPAAFELQCFHCHQQILAGEFKPPKRQEKRWREGVSGLRDVPSLLASQKRLRPGFIERFLQDPIDLRPRLAPTMPRLGMTAAEARDVAAYFGASEDPKHAEAAAAIAKGDAARGRALIEAKGCPACHAFTGVPPLAGAGKIDAGDRTLAPGMTLAPDFRYARERLEPDAVIAWLTSPKALKPDTAMPEFALAPGEIVDIAAYLLAAPLAPIDPPAAPARLPLLARKVGYDEVSAKVFRRTCWHCHGEPDYAAGDGGPGNTGGFGFKPRGVSLVDYGTVASGMIGDDGNRQSLFTPAKDGTPLLVAALLARREEEAGHPREGVRGMPLGFPSLSPEDVQLLESWIAQGRPP
jgi:cytochrome c2